MMQAQRWAERECADAECAAFAAALHVHPMRHAVAHDSYLINLASPDPALRAKSLDSFVAELRRSEALGLEAVVSHPGNYIDDRQSGVQRNADAITEALERTPGRVMVLLETTAGAGTVLGASFKEIAELIEAVGSGVRQRVGVCADTAHLHAAGYDLVTDYDEVWRRFDDIIGRERLGMLHLNDSKAPAGSRRDRHELIGEGTLGEAPFRRIMTDERLVDIPKVIETPKLDNATATDTRMLSRLREYAR